MSLSFRQKRMINTVFRGKILLWAMGRVCTSCYHLKGRERSELRTHINVSLIQPLQAALSFRGYETGRWHWLIDGLITGQGNHTVSDVEIKLHVEQSKGVSFTTSLIQVLKDAHQRHAG